MLRVLDGLALLVDAPNQLPPGHRGFRPSVPDWLPALVNAARAFLAIGAVELDLAGHRMAERGLCHRHCRHRAVCCSRQEAILPPAARIAVTLGVTGSIICAAIDQIRGAAGARDVPGLLRWPSAFFSYRSALLCGPDARAPAAMAVLTAMGVHFHAPPRAHQSDDAMTRSQFYNTAVAVFVGCGVAALSFRPVAAAVAGAADAPPARPYLARPPPPRDRPRAAEI